MAVNIAELLDKAILMHRLSSDYKLALVMGIDSKSMSNYRHGKTLPDTRVIALLCDLTGDDPAMLAAEIEVERAKTPEARAVWISVLSRLRETAAQTVSTGVFAALALGLLGSGAPSSQAHANTVYSTHQSGNVYYVKSITGQSNHPKPRATFASLVGAIPHTPLQTCCAPLQWVHPLYLRGSLL